MPGNSLPKLHLLLRVGEFSAQNRGVLSPAFLYVTRKQNTPEVGAKALVHLALRKLNIALHKFSVNFCSL